MMSTYEPIKLCKDCRWAALEEQDGAMTWLCTHRSGRFRPLPDYVTGKPVEVVQLPCKWARSDSERCGQEGKYWEPR